MMTVYHHLQFFERVRTIEENHIKLGLETDDVQEEIEPYLHAMHEKMLGKNRGLSPSQHSTMSIFPRSIRKALQAPLANHAGVTYLFVIILVAVMCISLMGVTQQWSVILKRDREAELLFRGTRIKESIERYVADYEVQKATRPNRWPRTLEELTEKNPKRYLQAVYTDPITGKDFDLIKVGEELHGVRSTSTDAPYDQVNFKNVKTYQAVRFESTGAGTNCQPNPLNPLVQQNCTPPTTAAPTPESSTPGPSETVPPNAPPE